MPATTNADILRRIYEEVFSKKKIEVLNEVIAKDCVDANPLPGATPRTAGDPVRL